MVAVPGARAAARYALTFAMLRRPPSSGIVEDGPAAG